MAPGLYRESEEQGVSDPLEIFNRLPIRQQRLFERVREYIHRDAEQFSSIQCLTELGRDLCDRPLEGEKDFRAYQRLAIKRPLATCFLVA